VPANHIHIHVHDAEFNESDHPREGGKFVSKGRKNEGHGAPPAANHKETRAAYRAAKEKLSATWATYSAARKAFPKKRDPDYHAKVEAYSKAADDYSTAADEHDKALGLHRDALHPDRDWPSDTSKGLWEGRWKNKE
jgi:hypothetical protein